LWSFSGNGQNLMSSIGELQCQLETYSSTCAGYNDIFHSYIFAKLKKIHQVESRWNLIFKFILQLH
jgi:hypothetical protein